MAAPRAPDLPAAIRSAETPKDLTRWHDKREVFHDLYICQRKSLNDVKTIMERDHAFPTMLKHSDYEHVLREEFDFRKNLSADDWRFSIGPQIASRKAAGKRSEVLLNGLRVQNVDRRIKRSSKSTRARRRAKALPGGVVIRTPSPQPLTFVASPMLEESHASKKIRGQKKYQSPARFLANSPAELDYLNLLMGANPLSDAASRAASLFSAQLLREGCPINKLLTILDEHLRKVNQEDFRLFGPNATISVLGKLCFDFSNNLQYKTISECEMKSIFDWIGFSVDIASLKTFFSQDTLTILAVWESLTRRVRYYRHLAAFDVLLSVRSSVTDHALQTIEASLHDLLSCITLAPNRVAMLLKAYPHNQCELDKALRQAIRQRAPMESLTQLISAGASLANGNPRISVDDLILDFDLRALEMDDLGLVEILLKAGAVVDEPLADDHCVGWPRPHAPIYVTDYILLRREQTTQIQGLLSLISLYSDRQQTTLTVPGIFEATQGGQEQLCSYLDSRFKPYDDQERKQVLEIALSEASGEGYANVVRSLLDFGVDPDVSILSRFKSAITDLRHQNTWHPVIRAARAGDLDTLRMLVTVTNMDNAFLHEEIGSQLDLGALRRMDISQRDQILRVLSVLDLGTFTRSKILLRALAANRWLYDHPDFAFVSQLLEFGLASLDYYEHLDRESPHILVDAIYRGCGVPALSFLTQLIERRGQIGPALSARTLGALAKAALRASRDRRDQFEFLAQNVEGFQSYIQENGLSLLSFFVENIAWACDREHDNPTKHSESDCQIIVTVKWFLDLGIPLKGSVLSKLIPHASENFIPGMTRSLDELNEVEMLDALESSISRGRLNLAVALIERGARVNGYSAWRGGRTALQEACITGAALWFIRFLLEKGAAVNAPPTSDGGFTALQAACLVGAQLSRISFLIEKGANVNAPPAPKNGSTAIQWAARQGMMNVAGLLLSHGADVNALSGYNRDYYSKCFKFDEFPDFARAIDLAAFYSRLDMVHFLAAAGARSSRPGSTGFDGAIEIATREENFAIARLLQEHADSCSGDPMEAEQVWLRANPQACMYDGRIQPASWVAFLNGKDRGSVVDFDKYLEKRVDYHLE